MAARLAPQKSSPDGTANPALEGDASSKPTPPARSGLHQTLDDIEVIPPTEPKAVLEHRTPKTSRLIFHRSNGI